MINYEKTLEKLKNSGKAKHTTEHKNAKLQEKLKIQENLNATPPIMTYC